MSLPDAVAPAWWPHPVRESGQAGGELAERRPRFPRWCGCFSSHLTANPGSHLWLFSLLHLRSINSHLLSLDVSPLNTFLLLALYCVLVIASCLSLSVRQSHCWQMDLGILTSSRDSFYPHATSMILARWILLAQGRRECEAFWRGAGLLYTVYTVAVLQSLGIFPGPFTQRSAHGRRWFCLDGPLLPVQTPGPVRENPCDRWQQLNLPVMCSQAFVLGSNTVEFLLLKILSFPSLRSE